jgi:hypothetical protein
MAKTRRRAPNFTTPTTTASMVELYETTLPLLIALRDVARPLARRRPEPVPHAVEAEAATLLAAARRVLSREPRVSGLIELREPLDWAILLSKLELALAGFASFRKRYSYFDRELGGHTWRDESWLSFQAFKLESANADKVLHESEEKLSTSVRAGL